MKEKRKKSNIILKIFLFIFIIIFVFTAYKVGQWGYDNIKSEKEYEDLIDEVISEENNDNDNGTENGNEDEQGESKVDFAKLKQKNSDVVGWIQIKSLGINYPIVQGSDNKYYLTRTINNKYSKNGSIFMDYQNSKKFDDNNTVIFGHNLVSGKMFAPLEKIVEGKKGKNVEITIITEQKRMKYKVFSSYKEKPNVTSIVPGLNDAKSYQDYITRMKQKTTVKYNIEPSAENKMITLSTCDISGKKRLIVHAINTSNQLILENKEI